MLIDLDLPPELDELRLVVRRFVSERLLPHEATLERSGKLPAEVWAQIESESRHLGFNALGIPVGMNGAGLGIVGQVLIAEEMGRVSVGFRHVVGTPAGSQAIARFGTQEQIDAYLLPWLAGKRWGAWAATEPDAGSDLGAMGTTAVEGGGGWRISGTKHFVTGLDRADFVTVFAKTTPELGIRGLTAFVIEKDLPGVTIGPEQQMMGRGGLNSFPLYLEEVELPDEARLGDRDSGIRVLMSNVGELRLLVAAHCVGVVGRLLDLAQSWGAERHQFGLALREIGQLQDYLAGLMPRYIACRVAVFYAAVRIEAGEEAREETAVVKAQCAELAFHAADRVMQLLGGYGYSRDMPVEALFRATRLWQIAEGSSEIQRLLIWRALKAGWRPRLDPKRD